MFNNTVLKSAQYPQHNFSRW